MANNHHIKIHQAYYGEINRSHGCLCSTINDVDLKAFLTGFTDRPSAIPPGTLMQPYISAIAYSKFYIVTITFPDDTAIRSGMVFTHVLIIRLEDIPYLNSLAVIFEHFISSIPNQKSSLQELTVVIPNTKINERSNTFPEYIIQVVRILATGNLPISFCGELSSFKLLVTSIWDGIPMFFRSQMSYSAGFSVSNIDSSKTIIHFQKNLINSLKNTDYISDESKYLIEANSTIEKFILSSRDDNQFENFRLNLNIDLNNWVLLQNCAKTYESYQNHRKANNDALKQLIRQIAKISPNQNDGISIKNEVISEIERRILQSEEMNLKSLRNLPINEFKTAKKSLSDAFKFRLSAELTAIKDFNVDMISELVILAVVGNENSSWWSEAIKESFQMFILFLSKENVINIWKLLSKSESSVTSTFYFLPNDKQIERLLLENIPSNLPNNVYNIIYKEIKDKGWAMLNAQILLQHLPPRDAIIQQLAFDRSLSKDSLEGFNSIIHIVSNEDILSLALDTNDIVYIEEYAVRSTNDQLLLTKLDVKNSIWLNIWSKSLEKTHDINYGVSFLQEKIDHILQNLIDGYEVPKVILDLISVTKFADVSRHKNRDKLWQYFNNKIKFQFLEATANSLLNDFPSRSFSELFKEPELIQFVCTDKYVTDMFRRFKNEISIILELLEFNSHVKDSLLSDYIKTYSNNITELQSVRLGNLILNKRLRQSARQVFEKAKNDNTFRTALARCKTVADLGFWDKLTWSSLINETISHDSVFSELASIAIRLYDKGPEDNDIWKRAGGDTGKLYSHKNREENWRSAIKSLKHGGGGKHITAKSLIKEMLEDHPKNNELNHLLIYFNYR